ncbi:MAG: hypothetical protein RBS85_02765 [Methanofastidiosum sp.]|jgi:hypothetical protein|nr:hypothetical protein [Methanofastidiosum sp.]
MVRNKLMDIGLYSLTINPLMEYPTKEISVKCDKCNTPILEHIINNIETTDNHMPGRGCNILSHLYRQQIPILRLFGFAISRNSLKTVSTFNEVYSLPPYIKGVHSVIDDITHSVLKKKPLICI